MENDKTLLALANYAGEMRARRQAELKAMGSKANSRGAYYIHDVIATQALIVAISGCWEDGVDPGKEAIARAEEMIAESQPIKMASITAARPNSL